ncbi:MAG: AbrB/MazE/SpoVT family DNA-binding domain-containing protein [Actinobacteria bacterium]|nr:AbrB/MazE/SpoVT family DNA-binding domain-containing protein [Actinomycetota bacterium]MBU1943233.1 AbrB/MazE/SpoVT family DNA-binding domain-containing protein [Actinomycetota bacterium]MBU2685956.1 AbrB/MazE/SpoVT family DNA-binding domain-containing protein [Actinomycetota bacterium]
MSDAVLRPKRQITIPKEVCDALDIRPGDTLELFVEESVLKMTPRKARALDALEEIRSAFERSGISEEGLLEEGRRVRREMAREPAGEE